MTNYELGKKAFLEGRNRAPAQCSDMMKKLEGIKVGGGSMPMMKDFLSGFDYANDESMRIKFPELYA